MTFYIGYPDILALILRRISKNRPTMNHQQMHQSIFWLYYGRGVLQSKLKQHDDAVSSFTASLDAKNYAQVLLDNHDLAQEELLNHKQILKTAERSIASKLSSSADLSIKAAAVKLAGSYKQVIEYFALVLEGKSTEKNILDLHSMFDIPAGNTEAQNTKLQYGYAHYYKGLSQVALDKKKDAIESFNIANKLMPYFAESYIQKAYIFKEQKKFKKALVQYDAAIQLESDNAELYFARATLLFELGKTEEAKNDFNRYQLLISDSDGLKLYDKPAV